jgi:hypothetical protein
MSVPGSRDTSAEATVFVLEDTHDFEASDGTRLWQIGFVPIDEDGDFLPEDDHQTSDPAVLLLPCRRCLAPPRGAGGC